MKILQVVGDISTVGGIEHYVQRLSHTFSEEGHETVIVTNKVPANAPPCPVVAIPDFVQANPDRSRREAEVLAYAASYQPDVVLSHTTPHGPLLTALDAQFPTAEFMHVFFCAGGKLFRSGDRVCTHAVGPRCLVDWYIGPCGLVKSPRTTLHIYRQTTQHIAAVKRLPAALVATDFMREYLIGEGMAPERVHLAEYNLGIPAAQPVRHIEKEIFTLLFVGRIVYNKGVQYALDALTHLDASYRLTVVGDGWYRQDAERQAARLGLLDRVRFTGFLRGAELEAQYAQADAALVPSFWPEPAGLVVPEARGRGLPVIAFDTGGIAEWVTRYGYDAVYLARRADAVSLADSIAQARVGTAPSPQKNAATPARPVSAILEQVIRDRKS